MGTNLLIKNGRLLLFEGDELVVRPGSILIENTRIAEVGVNVRGLADRVLDCSGGLVMPGLVNAHFHSTESFSRGRFDNLPLEVWRNFTLPSTLDEHPLTERELYLRTMLGCLEMLRVGVTTAVDEVNLFPHLCEETAKPVFQAYQDAGIRARIGVSLSNKAPLHIVPFLEEIMPKEIQERLASPPTLSAKGQLDFARALHARWSGSGSRINCSINPSAPQRCTDKFLGDLWTLAEQLNIPFFTHVLETKVQAVTGRVFYGQSIVGHLDDLGLLTPRTNLIHGVWVTEEDIDRIASCGASVVSNPVSNLKLGAGIAPLRKYMCAGVNLALGSDGTSSNDRHNAFETMKFASLLQKVTGPDIEGAPTAKDVFRMATEGGARCAGLKGEVGAIVPGKIADLVIVDLHRPHFTPLQNVLNHLVYCEDGSSVRTSIIGGEIVMQDGKIRTVDENALIEEAARVSARYFEKHAKGFQQAEEMAPYFWQVHRRCAEKVLGVNRWMG